MRKVLKFLKCSPYEGLDLEKVERSLIREALRKTHGNKTEAAKLLEAVLKPPGLAISSDLIRVLKSRKPRKTRGFSIFGTR